MTFTFSPFQRITVFYIPQIVLGPSSAVLLQTIPEELFLLFFTPFLQQTFQKKCSISYFLFIICLLQTVPAELCHVFFILFLVLPEVAHVGGLVKPADCRLHSQLPPYRQNLFFQITKNIMENYATKRRFTLTDPIKSSICIKKRNQCCGSGSQIRGSISIAGSRSRSGTCSINLQEKRVPTTY